MKRFQPKIIKDPKTGKERLITPEEQMRMLEKGILLDAEITSPQGSENNSSDHQS